MNYQMELFRLIAVYSISKNLSIGQEALQVADTALSVFHERVRTTSEQPLRVPVSSRIFNRFMYDGGVYSSLFMFINM